MQPKAEIRLILATRNVHKLNEIKEILGDLPVRLESLLDYPQIPEIDETGETFTENALLKAETVHSHTGDWAIADDSGLEVDALNGAPGVYSARFAGDSRNYAENNRKLLALLKNTPEHQRGAQFRCVAAILGPGFKKTVVGVVRGRIATGLRGDKGFGYDPLFIPEGYERTFAELREETKNRISHRALAFRQVRAVLEDLI